MTLNSSADADARETLDLFGPRIQFLTRLSDEDDGYCLIAGVVPPGVAVPVHSHAERKTFYLLEGEMQGLRDNRWIALGAGEMFDVPGGLKHAWRNASVAPASMLVVTPMRLARFFRDVGRSLPLANEGPPTPADFRRFADIANRYGYWLGGPADNAAVGISLF